MAEETSTPMGGDLPEERNPVMSTNHPRNVYALDTLVSEIAVVFEAPYEVSMPTPRNANTGVRFSPTADEWDDMVILFEVLAEDERIAYVKVDDDAGTITVVFWPNAVTQDSREPFGVADAAVGLDRQIGPDDLTPLAADLSSGAEGFTEGSL